MDTVNKLIYEFSWDQKPCIHVYNKMDIAPKEKVFQTNSHPKVFTSALKRTGLDKLKNTIGEVVSNIQTEEDKIYSLDRKAFIYKKEVSSFGVLCYIRMGVAQVKEWKNFIIKP